MLSFKIYSYRSVAICFFVLASFCEINNGETLKVDTEDTVRTSAFSLIKETANLPCDVRSTLPKDRPVLVLWYKDTTGTPVYSFDARETSLVKGTHWSHDQLLGNRGKFILGSKASHRRIVGKPFRNDAAGAYLELSPVNLNDQGVFRCRVDFLRSPTRNTVVRFTVIVLPKPPAIFNETNIKVSEKSSITAVIGPYNEGDRLILHCESSGGNPLPELKWYVNKDPFNSKTVRLTGKRVRNSLVIEKLERRHLHAILKCKASNYNKTAPLIAAVSLNMNFRPSNVSIRPLQESIVAEDNYELICDSSGSRPAAIITWWKGGTMQMDKSTTVTSHENDITTSVLRYHAATGDNQKYLTCRAENPSIYPSAMEDGMQLNILYRPLVTLQMGSNLDPSSIKEDDDVYFECHISANPEITKVIFNHNGVQIHNSVRNGIIIQNQTLALQKIKRTGAGMYSCQAYNSEGTGRSNSVNLEILYKPYCRKQPQRVYGASLHEPISVTCQVDARPGPVTFRWTFNNTSEHLPISSSAVLSNDFTSSAMYIPKEQTDYGTILCWAFNSIGEQSNPCGFTVIPAAVPQPLENCSIANQTTDSIEVECDSGFDGGLIQSFFMEVYNSRTEILYKNLTSNIPNFTLRSFKPGLPLLMLIYASNSKGISKSAKLETYTLKIAEKRTSPPGFIGFTPWVGVVLGTIFALVMMVLIITIIIRMKSPTDMNDDNVSSHYKENMSNFGNKSEEKFDNVRNLTSQDTVAKSRIATRFEEVDPDVIPQNSAANKYHEQHIQKQTNDSPTESLLVSNPLMTRGKVISALTGEQQQQFISLDGSSQRISSTATTRSELIASVYAPLLNAGTESIV